MRASRRLLAISLVLLGISGLRAAIIEEIVANVNGEIITMTALQKREREVQQAMYGNLSGADLDAAMEKVRKELLVDMINEKLLFQRAQRLGLDMEQVYKSSLENIKAQNNIKTSDELYDLLKQQGMTVEEFRENLLKYNVPDIMINIEVRQKISVSDAEAKEYYDSHTQEFSHPTTYTFREIAILLDKHSKDEALGIAEQVRTQALAGTAFEQLVEQYSEAPSREVDGLVEDLPAPEMSSDILEALVHLEDDGISKPVTTSRAVFVLKLVHRADAKTDPLEDVRAQVDSAVMREKFQTELQAYFRNLWKDNWICVFPKYEKKYPTSPYDTPTCS